LPGPLFPNELSQGVEYDKLAEEIRSNEIIRDELLSQDGTLALVMLSLNPDAVGGGKLNKVVEDILKSMADDLADSTFPKGSSLYAPETLSVIAEVLESQRGVANVWSLETLQRWLAEKLGKSDAGAVKEYVDALPNYLVRRFIDADQEAVVVEGRVLDKGASELLPIVNELDQKFDAERKSHPGYGIAMTGLSAIAARSSADMIGGLVRSIVLACGLAVTAFSDLPTLRLFERLSVFAMLMTLTAFEPLFRWPLSRSPRHSNADSPRRRSRCKHLDRALERLARVNPSQRISLGMAT
jgi:hypothetical protein